MPGYEESCLMNQSLTYSDLFDYFKKERSKLIESLEKLPGDEFTKNRELSFYSIKDVFLHTVNVEDNWLHYRLPGIPEPGLRPDKYRNLEDIKSYIVEVDGKTLDLFKRMNSDLLKKEVRRKYPDGRESFYTLDQLLYHIPIEVIHHYGEIFAEFWKMNIDAPYLSFLNYSKERYSSQEHK
jgi:uncharacterized damage-inducible protein DinB